MKILVTGPAGFIGFHLVRRLLERGDEVFGIDNINDYYDLNIKYGRLSECGIARPAADSLEDVTSTIYPGYRFRKIGLEDRQAIMDLISCGQFDAIVNLAAQAGVRYSLINPYAYVEGNIVGFLNVLEGCRVAGIKHLVYASSSSVYGLNESLPFSTSDNVDHPISLYAASKKSNELMAHTYSHLYGIPTTGLRFFTVYGPWGRPDMALFLFTKAMMSGKTIKVFNHGQMRRDFTYIDDIVEGIVRVVDRPPTADINWRGTAPNPGSSSAPYKVYNIGNSNPVELMDYIHAIEKALGINAEIEYLPMQPGDVPATWADITDLERDMGYRPTTTVTEGINNFVTWYQNFYRR